jgi:CheY-like chemotaxis protein
VTEDELWGDGEVVYLTIQVQDTGRGLDDVERNFLFKRFSQATPRTHVQYGGSGLGLFISKELTEAQGGQIGVASTAGVGSTFAFFVRSRRCERPLAPLPITPQSFKKSTEQTRILTDKAILQIHGGPVPRLAAITTTSAPASLLPTMSSVAAQENPTPVEEDIPLQKHVLVVEDNLVNQKVLSKQLRAAGCVVHVANHGAEAINFLENSQFWHTRTVDGTRLSVILMDLEMPVMDGLTAVKIIRSLQQEDKVIAHVPVVAVTANARSEQIQTAMAAGMDSVVTKPFRIPDLMPELEKWARATEVELSMPMRRQSDR